MPDNTERFTGRAEAYDHYRQRYPTEEVLARLREWCGLKPEWVVADVGAGTGMLAEVFLANGNRVQAVEPNPDMRNRMRAAVESHLGASMPLLKIIDATAEETTLPAGSVDIVGAGRAFHWFDKACALAEFRRVLKPGGWVALLAADRDRDSTNPVFRPQVDAFEILMSKHGIDYTRVRSGHRAYDAMDSFFKGDLHQVQLPGLRQLDWVTFRGHAQSLSVSPAPGHPGYSKFEKALRLYFDTYSSEGVLSTPTVCWITAGQFSPP